jgi:hypothetical protein
VSKVDDLIERYEHNASLPWKRRMAGSQKVWFVVYPPRYEREIRARIDEFKLATERADHDWIHHDLTTAFPKWMADHEYREGYFQDPEDLDFIMDDFLDHLAQRIRGVLDAASEDSVVALTGIGTLYGLIFVSDLIDKIESSIPGRLAVFFPGRHERNTYRLLDARDGWDYLALPIKA